MLDRAQRRLTAALGVSALLHLWLAHTAQGPQLERAPRANMGSGVPLTVLFKGPPLDLLALDSDPRILRAADRDLIQTAATSAVSGTVAAPKSVERPAVTAVIDTAGGSAALAQPSDPTYYPARSLDEYPRAATALDLGALLAAGSNATGQVRATVLIDESGIVNEVRAIEAVASDIEVAVRDLLLHARFTPARKDGRVVKAQLRVSLDYGARQAP